MHITKNGVTIDVPDATIIDMVLERLNGSAAPVDLRATAAPAIGAEWRGQGGIYAGVCRGRDGAPDYHLILGPEHDTDIDWNGALAWAGTVEVDGKVDFSLPFRAEQSILFGNLKDHFRERAYWSCEQLAGGSDCAWCQTFYDGNQYGCNEDGKLRARLVRRLPI